MDNLTRKVLIKIVQDRLKENHSLINDALLSTVDSPESLDPTIVSLISSGIDIAVSVSVQIVLEQLLESDVLKPLPEDQLRKFLFESSQKPE